MNPKKYEDLVALLRDAAVVIGRSQRIIAANTLVCEITGYTKDALLKMTAEDLISESESSIRRGLSTRMSDATLMRKDAEPLPYAWWWRGWEPIAA